MGKKCLMKNNILKIIIPVCIAIIAISIISLNSIGTSSEENNFSTDDSIMIIRSLLSKSKRILSLKKDFPNNSSLEQNISAYKPPIFWKEKDIVRTQLNKWKPEKIKELIYLISDIELQIKKDYKNSILIVTDFIIAQGFSEISN